MAYVSAITGATVRRWYGERARNAPTEAECAAIADELGKFRSRVERDARKSGASTEPQSSNLVEDYYWESERVSDAAKLLIETIPKQIRHWESLRRADPKTSIAGAEAIRRLSNALNEALPYIEWPFGKYDKAKGYRTSVEWHPAAVIVAGVILRATGESASIVGLNKDSRLPRVVFHALKELEYKTITVGAVSQHLMRWNKKYGLPGP